MGPVDPYDEAAIGDEDKIIRRISSEYIVPDQNTGGERVSTMAFSASSAAGGGMSVDVLALIVAGGDDPQTFVTTPIFMGSVQFSAGAVRRTGLWVGYEPVPGNRYHGEVWRPPSGGRFSRPQQKALNNASDWFVEIPGVSIVKK